MWFGRYAVFRTAWFLPLYVVVALTLKRSFYPTTLAVPPVSFLILHPRDTNYVVTDIETTKKQTSLIKEGKSSTSVTGTRAQHKKKHHPGNKSYEKIQNE